MAVTGAIFPKKYANEITWHEQNKKLSHATSVGNKLKQTEDRNKIFIYNMSSDLLVFALYMNQMSHPTMFPTSNLTTMMTKRGLFMIWNHWFGWYLPSSWTRRLNRRCFQRFIWGRGFRQNYNSILCHIDTLLFPHCIHTDTLFFPYCTIMT